MATITRIETFVYRVPAPEPIRTSFGIIPDRPAVFVRIEDSDGAFGWGEIWANFPSMAPEYRAQLFDRVIAVGLLGSNSASDPVAVWHEMDRKLHILSLQSGDLGGFAAAIAGADIALHDLAARRSGQPLWRYLGGLDGSPVPVYGSGINPGPSAVEKVQAARELGFRAFKLKIGFGEKDDIENVERVMKRLEPGEQLMVDINQAYDVTRACHIISALQQFPLAWVEEPIPVDRPQSEWAQIKVSSLIPIAAGENVRGLEEFEQIIADRRLSVVQPDVCKWGGISGTFGVAHKAVAAGLMYCPHFLGGGIGLMASLHLLAAVRGNGLLETDVNPNLLREELVAGSVYIKDSGIKPPNTSGIGITPDLAPFSGLRTFYAEAVHLC